jgi:hypothetical protein
LNFVHDKPGTLLKGVVIAKGFQDLAGTLGFNNLEAEFLCQLDSKFPA